MLVKLLNLMIHAGGGCEEHHVEQPPSETPGYGNQQHGVSGVDDNFAGARADDHVIRWCKQ